MDTERQIKKNGSTRNLEVLVPSLNIHDQMFCFGVLFNNAVIKSKYRASDALSDKKGHVEICKELKVSNVLTENPVRKHR